MTRSADVRLTEVLRAPLRGIARLARFDIGVDEAKRRPVGQESDEILITGHAS